MVVLQAKQSVLINELHLLLGSYLGLSVSVPLALYVYLIQTCR